MIRLTNITVITMTWMISMAKINLNNNQNLVVFEAESDVLPCSNSKLCFSYSISSSLLTQFSLSKVSFLLFLYLVTYLLLKSGNSSRKPSRISRQNSCASAYLGCEALSILLFLAVFSRMCIKSAVLEDRYNTSLWRTWQICSQCNMKDSGSPNSGTSAVKKAHCFCCIHLVPSKSLCRNCWNRKWCIPDIHVCVISSLSRMQKYGVLPVFTKLC